MSGLGLVSAGNRPATGFLLVDSYKPMTPMKQSVPE